MGNSRENLHRIANARHILPAKDAGLRLFGTESVQAERNRLQGRWLVNPCAGLGREEVRGLPGNPTGSTG